MQERPRGGLTGSQLEIMEIFWQRSPAEATAAEVWQALQESRPVARTTVLTLLQRLERRGWLTREGAGRGAIYRPAARPEETTTRLATDFLDAYFGGSASRLVMSLLGGRQVTAEEARQMREMLEAYEKERKEKTE
jgi:BlaI family transcriptional regulator, penicillinase repressor